MEFKLPSIAELKKNKLKGARTYIFSALLAAHGGVGLASDGPTYENPYQQDPISEILIGGGMASLRAGVKSEAKKNDNQSS